MLVSTVNPLWPDRIQEVPTVFLFMGNYFEVYLKKKHSLDYLQDYIL